MNPSIAPIDSGALIRLAGIALLLAAWPLIRWRWRQRYSHPRPALAALTWIAAFLAFDLIVFGAFTRLSDSGLGCPDWPGCYGQTSPIAAADPIHSAELAMPTGPVTFAKAWIEMVHRYLAMTIGLLIIVLAFAAWIWRRSVPVSPAWSVAILIWVVVQGLFGRWTVTSRLAPAVVSMHLLGGLVLLGLLVALHQRLAAPEPDSSGAAIGQSVVGQTAIAIAMFVVVAQSLLGAWVSSNYAVLACSGFPTCNGDWWPRADFASGFELLRPLGRASDGSLLPFDALVAIQITHRMFALVAAFALAAVAWRLGRSQRIDLRRPGIVLAMLLGTQLATGLSNIALGWPLAAALAHSAGAAALMATLVVAWSRVGGTMRESSR